MTTKKSCPVDLPVSGDTYTCKSCGMQLEITSSCQCATDDPACFPSFACCGKAMCKTVVLMLAIGCLLFAGGAARAQESVFDRIGRLEAAQAQTNTSVNVVQTKIDDLSSKVAAMSIKLDLLTPKTPLAIADANCAGGQCATGYFLNGQFVQGGATGTVQAGGCGADGGLAYSRSAGSGRLKIFGGGRRGGRTGGCGG